MMALQLLKCRRVRFGLAAVSAIPALLWALVLALAPTEWARARLVAEVETATGRKVSIGAIRLGPLGDVRLGDLALAEPGAPGDPWLTVEEARLDVHLLGMLGGCCSPTEVALDGVALRVHRRADGSMEFGDLFAPSARARRTKPEDEGGESPGGRPVNVTLTRARVLVVDDRDATRLELTEAEGRATCSADRATVEAFKGRLGGGTVEMAARLDRGAPTRAFEAEFRVRDVDLGGCGLVGLGLLVPVSPDLAESVDGRLKLNLKLSGLAGVPDTLKGHGAICLEPVDLSQSKFLDAIDALKAVPRSSRVGSVESHFAIGGGRVWTDALTIKVARIPITLAGWTGFDGRLDYEVRSIPGRDRLVAKLPPEARALLDDLGRDIGDLGSLRIGGSIDAPRLIAGPSGAGGPPRVIDGDRLRETAKRVEEKYLR